MLKVFLGSRFLIGIGLFRHGGIWLGKSRELLYINTD
jgi:hypothetical protein